MCARMSAYTHVCVCQQTWLHMNIQKKSQLMVTNQTIACIFFSPNDLRKPYNMAAGPRITVCHPKIQYLNADETGIITK